MLSFAEENVLVALDEETGELVRTSSAALSAAVAGSLLMDLALADRIDTDHRELWVVCAEATGNSLLDITLTRLEKAGERRAMSQVVRRGVSEAPALKRAALDRLVERGILRREESTFAWVSSAHRCPTVDGAGRREARTELRGVE
jgi:hypothetical protein